jgi:hypothetical protein
MPNQKLTPSEKQWSNIIEAANNCVNVKPKHRIIGIMPNGIPLVESLENEEK